MNYILSNQDTVLAQITQLESGITQTEVINTYRADTSHQKDIHTLQRFLSVDLHQTSFCVKHTFSNLERSWKKTDGL